MLYRTYYNNSCDNLRRGSIVPSLFHCTYIFSSSIFRYQKLDPNSKELHGYQTLTLSALCGFLQTKNRLFHKAEVIYFLGFCFSHLKHVIFNSWHLLKQVLSPCPALRVKCCLIVGCPSSLGMEACLIRPHPSSPLMDAI